MPPSIPRISNGEAHLIDQFIKDLEGTADQVQKLLDTVRASELDFAAIKTELRLLCINVKEISSILRDGDGGVSLITRIALLEQRVKELEKDLDKKDDLVKTTNNSLVEINVADKHGKWQLRMALATGILGLIGSIIAALANHFK
jgi:adenine deaminase